MASPFFEISHIQGSTVLVTGASGVRSSDAHLAPSLTRNAQGIGAATGVLFAQAGCNVVLTARRLDKLEEVKSLALQANEQGGTGQGGKVVAMALDMQDKAAVDGFVDKLPDEVKDVDILVNNAGLVGHACVSSSSSSLLNSPRCLGGSTLASSTSTRARS